MNQKSPRAVGLRSQRPRSPRVPVEFALEVTGKSASGKPFHVHAQAIKISRGGATIVLDVEVAVGSIVRLTPPFGHELDAEVNGTWLDTASGSRLIGVKLLDTDGWFSE